DISVKPALNDPNPSISTSNDTRIIEKENVTLRPEAPKLQTTGVMLTSYVSAVERRHLTCKTPVSSPRRTPLRHKNEKFDQTEMDEYLVNISNPHDSMHLIDLTTPVKSRRPSSVRKVFSGKVVQSPRVLDAINLITPSPKKVNRTPISSKAPAPATPKVALLKSAIKNSRIHASDTKKTPLASSLSSKKTPNVKINTLRTDTPKVTPTSSKSSLVKLRKHLISSLNKQDPADTKAPMMVSAALSQHSTPVHVPITSVITLKDDHVSPTHQQSKQADVPEYENFMIENVEKTAVENAAVVVPIFDVQSVIKKPNRTTQIRSAKYSDVTPHESFMDGVTPAAAVPSEENTLMLHADNSVSVPSNTLQEELNNLSDLPTSIHPHRNSCLPNTTMQFSPQPSNSRKTISAVNYNSLSISPMSRVSIAEDSIKETDVNDLDSETSSLDEIVNEDELLASSDSESVHEIEPMVGEVGVRTPQLGHSLRDTRKFIGSAFTSLNTSRPQLDLTAEIDESLLLNDEEEDCDNNEFYNMEKSHESILTNEQIISNNVTVCDQTAKQMEAVSDSCSKFTSNYLSNRSKRVSDFSIHEQLESAGAVLDSSKETLNTTEDCSSTSAIRCVPSTMQNQTSDACVEANNEMQSMYSTPKALHPTEALKRQSICINLVGVKELLKTPKIVDADIHAGQEIEEMFRTPKSGSLSATGKKRSVVKLVGSEELHKTSIQGNADTQEYLDVGLKGTVLLGGNIEDSFENNELLKSPKSIYSADADLKESTNVELVDVADPASPSANMEDNCEIEAMVKTPKPVSDADQNESICAVLVDSDEALSPTTDIEDNCE
uniref:Uncharacterized protein n=1 Tax=Anopheles christyi TaxID=43041 RepID=A0A182JSJ6_9DIPT